MRKLYESLRGVRKRIAEHVNNTLGGLPYGMRALVTNEQFTPLKAIIIDSINEEKPRS